MDFAYFAVKALGEKKRTGEVRFCGNKSAE